MLEDSRVDPSAKDNQAIQGVAYYGQLNVVNRLLEDSRVDPSAGDNWAIRCAAKYGHFDVVNRLLEDKRVDPTVIADYIAKTKPRM